MKGLQRNIARVGMVLVCAFVALSVWLGYMVYSQGARWTTNPYNTRLKNAKKQTGMGDILDCNGVILACTDEEGVRRYAEDERMRRALSQTVGDQLGMSGTGVESFHASTLLNLSGSFFDRTFQYIMGENPRGDTIRLTVDAALARYISKQFPEGYEGAVAVINYKTGAVLAMVSKPDYDPIKVIGRQGDPSGSGYLNRCLQGMYTPGSVFKIVTLAAALEKLDGVIDRQFVCEGVRQFGSARVTEAGKATHGELTLLEAFQRSCNVTFAALGYELGDAALIQKAEEMGFCDNFRFRDLVLYESQIEASLPDTGQLAWTAVGQGKTQVTPLHMAMIAGAVANEGVMMEPNLIAQVTGVGNIIRLRPATGVYRQCMTASVANAVKRAMMKTVQAGTAKSAAIEGLRVGGKTGSAETSNDKTKETNAWYVGFLDEEEYPFAIAVVVEEGGSGGNLAAKLAKKAMDKAVQLTDGQRE